MTQHWTFGGLFRDGIRNVVSRMGTALDKGAATEYFRGAELTLDQIEAAFATSWVLKKIAKTVPFDATRRWREWDEGEDRAAEIAKTERRFMVQQKVQTAQTRARVYGGAGLLIGIKGQSIEEPLDPSTVNKGDLEFLTGLTRLELSVEDLEQNATSENYGLPKAYRIMTGEGSTLSVHPSRVVRFIGEEPGSPFRAMGQYYGWGESIFESIIGAGQSIDSAASDVRSLLAEAKTDVIKIPGLSQNITDPKFEAALLKRAETARFAKGNHGIMMLDGEEEYVQNSYAYTGLGDVLDRFMVFAAGAADIPITRLFGVSPGGLNSTGRSDLINYYDRVQAMQTGEMSPAMDILDQCIARSTFGAEPDGEFKWREIEQMTEEQIADIRDKTAKMIKTLAETQLFDDQSVADAGANALASLGVKGLEDDSGQGETKPGEDGVEE